MNPSSEIAVACLKWLEKFLGPEISGKPLPPLASIQNELVEQSEYVVNLTYGLVSVFTAKAKPAHNLILIRIIWYSKVKFYLDIIDVVHYIDTPN